MIRSAAESDTSEVVRLVKEILQGEFSSDPYFYATDDLEKLIDAYPAPNNAFFVAVEQGRIVGTLGVKAEDAHTAILRRLFVSPQHRKQGLGGQLMKEALVFCRKRGFRQIIIRTSSRMEQAIRLCRSVGFEEFGEWTLGEVNLIRFRLRLT